LEAPARTRRTFIAPLTAHTRGLIAGGRRVRRLV